VEPELVKEKATFEGDLDAGSLDIVDLLLALEEEFDIELNESLVKSIVTVKDVIDHIQRETK
jgi:acyl carrier protein